LVGGVYSLAGLLRAAGRVEDATDLELSLSRLRRGLVEAETAQRGYLASGDGRFLAIYQHYHAEARAYLAPGRELERLNRAVRASFDELDATRAAYDHGLRGSALAASMQRGTEALDAVREQVDEAESEEARVGAERQHGEAAKARWTLALSGAALLVFAVVVVAMVMQRRRYLREAELHQRIEGLLEAARRDLDAMTRLHHALQDSEERFRLAFEYSPIGKALVDLDDRILRVNTAFCRIVGGEGLTGREFEALHHPEDREAGRALRAGLLRDGVASEARALRFLRSDGSIVETHLRGASVRDRDGRPRYLVIQIEDLAERKRAERARELGETIQLAERFIAILGHDLRNPLSAIQMAAAHMKSSRSEDATWCLDRIQSCARRMTAMVSQLLDLTRARLGTGIEVNRVASDLAEIITGAVEELRLVYPGRDIRCDLSSRAKGEWDPDRLAQVVSNLVGNALEHGDHGRAVEVSLEASPRGVELEVRSSGAPIPAELLPTIFDPFRRGGRTTGKGLGLGLFIARQIVAAHGGTIGVESTEERGTRFTVSLPYTAVEPASEAGLIDEGSIRYQLPLAPSDAITE
jgi:PAS domain S-box-containing protein